MKSKGKGFTIALTACLLVILALVAFARPNLTQPNWEFLPHMKRSPAYQAFEVATDLSNGRVQQRPVSGIIARGHLPLHFTASKDDAIRAGEELTNPFPPPGTADIPIEKQPPGHDPAANHAASVQRGEVVYGVYCVCCHGPAGAGDGPVAQKGFPPPPSLPTGKSAQMKDGQLFHILTYGQGSMASMAAQLDHDPRWDVINFVRSLQAKAAPAATVKADEEVPSTPVSAPTQP